MKDDLFEAIEADEWNMRNQIIGSYRKQFAKLTDKQLHDYIVCLKRERLNDVVKHGKFPAWDLARDYYTLDKAYSAKMRTALINVTAFYIFAEQYARNMELEDIKAQAAMEEF